MSARDDSDLARWRLGFEDGWIYGADVRGRLTEANAQALADLRHVGDPMFAGPPQIGEFAPDTIAARGAS